MHIAGILFRNTIPLFRQKIRWFLPVALLAPSCTFVASAQQAPRPSHPLELSRPARPWEYLSAMGTRAGLLGNESGRMEAWVYPLKIFRDFHLKFHTDGRVIPAEALARTVVVHPESATILYSSDTFNVRETFFVPIAEQGALIVLDIETEFPLEIEAAFRRDFQLEWPAGLGATYLYWVPERTAFYFSEERKQFAALVGSPSATQPQTEYQTNYSESEENSFRLGVTAKGKETKVIAIAASTEGRLTTEGTYQRLLATYPQLLEQSAAYYENYLERTVRLDLPDGQLQKAYDWSRVSMLQGMVTNPFLGTGLVAGYRTSGESQRPGFAWYFGRDSCWTSFALNADGDFATSRTALEFISKYQREDGKMPHEVAQGANFVDWFKDYPYPYASADATPLYIIAVNDYMNRSGDTAFPAEKWASLWKAYEFLKSTYDLRGLPQNLGIGHGWVEGGPLLPVKTELYQAALGAEALRALAQVARKTNHTEQEKSLLAEFEKRRSLVNEAFWIAQKKRFAFALDKEDRPMDEPTVLSAVPMWFSLLEGPKADAMISQLADFDQQTDWGMRIISAGASRFSGGGYHFGSVWPLFTGWASVGEYQYHRVFPAYQNLRANALLALDGSLGHVTEVLSGDNYQPLSTSSPHQMWSAAMVVSPLLKGLLGLDVNAESKTLVFAPHVPAEWTHFRVENVPVGQSRLSLNYSRTAEVITLVLSRESGNEPSTIEFRPALSVRARVLNADCNGKQLPFRLESGELDQHIIVTFPVAEEKSVLRIHLANDFALSVPADLPPLGYSSRGLRVVSQTWSPAKDQLTLDVAGAESRQYELTVWNSGEIEKVEGAEFSRVATGDVLHIKLPPDSDHPYPHAKVIIHFTAARKSRR